MKATSIISRLTASVLLFIIGALVLQFAGVGTTASFVVSGALFTASQLPLLPKTTFRAGLYPELWTGELVDKFRHTKSWLSTIARRDDLVRSNAIHLVDVGVDPNVLINNTTYPISNAQRTDADIVLSLDKFDTENTRITKDELYNLPYDKTGSVIQDHRLALEDRTAMKSAHSIAPTTGTGTTPIIPCTGALDGRTVSRKMITEADIIGAKESLDNLDIPMEGRILVLCTEHYNDLLKLNQDFANKYKNLQSGELLPNWYGFQIYQYNRVPVYTKAASVFTKKAFGAASTPATEYKASWFYYAPRAVQAVGTAEMFFRDAATDPEYREHKVGFRLYHLCLPKKTTGFGAIVADA